MYGENISFSTRFQGQWPRAWEAFGRNIFFGSGYSVLSVAADSDYLRALGETGLLGLGSFLFILLIFFIYTRTALPNASPLVRAMTIGVNGGLVGLLITASLLDVFEASKMAYVFWLTVGATIAGLGITYKKQFNLWKHAREIISHPIVFIILVGLLVPIVYAGVNRFYFVADDFTWLRWAGEAKLSDLSRYFLDSTGFFYRPLTKLYFYFASMVFWLKPEGYHSVNLVLHFVGTVLAYLIVRRLKNTIAAILTALFFLVASIHHENVIWISGVSSLAGSVFALLSLYLWILRRPVFSLTFLITSMLFYEEMMFVPLILTSYSWIFWPKKSRVVSTLPALTVPLYWWLRSMAHALSPGGSYGINLAALPFNAVGNIVGYVVVTIIGASMLVWYEWMRGFMRNEQLIAALTVTIALLVFLYYRKKIQLSKPSLFFVIFTCIALLPALGLGNIAERYGYLASVGISFLFVSFVLWMFQRRKVIAVALFTLIFGANYLQLQNYITEWQQTGKVSERIHYELRRMYYPIEPNTHFVVANVPTRIGRAWLFPVGLEDAAYHVFYDSTMKLDVVGSAEDALSVKGAKALTIVDDKEYPIRELYE